MAETVAKDVLARNLSSDSLSCKSIAFELEVPCALLGGEAGDEKMPLMGSIPCSSRTPVSFKVMPVFLQKPSAPSLALQSRAQFLQTHRPTFPTSKYCAPVLPLRPGVLREAFFASLFIFAAAMLRGRRFSFSGSSLPSCICSAIPRGRHARRTCSPKWACGRGSAISMWRRLSDESERYIAATRSGMRCVKDTLSR